jgi:uncharacterized protein YkwD
MRTALAILTLLWLPACEGGGLEAGDPLATPTCPELGFVGACKGTVALWCEGETLRHVDCMSFDTECAFIDDQTGHYCVSEGVNEAAPPTAPTPPVREADPPPSDMPGAPTPPPAPAPDDEAPPAPELPPAEAPPAEDPPSAEPGPAPDPPAEPPAPNGDPCDGLDYMGECRGGTAAWCENGEFNTRDCDSQGQECRWIDDQTGFYCGAPARPPAPEGGGDLEGGCGQGLEAQNVVLTNGARSQGGLGELACDDLLTQVARAHSQDMCDRRFFSHTNPNREEPWDRVRAAGGNFGFAGENIAMGYATAERTHTGWMNSPGHRRNILNRSYRRIGVGFADCNGGNYWTQVFTD